MNTLWIVSGGAEAVPGVERAKEMGLFVVVSDADPNAPAAAIADDFVLASTYDVDATVAAARNYHNNKRRLDGVVCVAADVPLTVAAVAEELGLPGLPSSVARIAMDKLAMKQRFQEQDIPIPWFSRVSSPDHLREIIKEKGNPLVIKPVDSRGARGVVRLTTDVDPLWAFEHARQFSPTGRVMAEEYLPGPQISTETMMIEGQGITPGFADRNYEFLDKFAPFIIENGGEQPSRLNKKEQAAVRRCAERAARALGIKNGIAKGDMVLTPDGARVIEVAARLSGGWFSTDQVPLATGVDLVGAAIRQALGRPVSREELQPVREQGVAIRYFFPPPGTLVRIEGIERWSRKPWVHRLGFFIQPGEMVERVSNHTKRAGFVITTGNDREQAVERAYRVVEGIRWHIDPS